MKVYVLINSNEEGTNFNGVFDTMEAAQAACDRINAAGKQVNAELFGDDPDELKRMDEFFDWWDATKVIEWEMNTAREVPR